MKIVVNMCGTCGELAQGYLNEEPFLITCPIEKFSTVIISDEFHNIEGLGEKCLKMLEKVLRKFNMRSFNFGIKLYSELPKGKGMASSSADIAAVARAMALYFNKNISAEELGHIASEIEPTDGIFYDGIVAMNPLTGQVIKKIYSQEKFWIAIFDYGGTVDTLKIQRQNNFQISELSNIIDPQLIKKSAQANQNILPKRGLYEIMNLSDKLGAFTVNVAHSGTVIGIFFHEHEKHLVEKIQIIKRNFKFLKFLTLTRLLI